MNSSKWWMLSLVFLCIPLQVHAQTQIETLSLEDVVELFEQNSLQQELAKMEELRRQGEAQRYKTYMNPEVSVFSEQLNAGTVDYDETTWQVSQPIELLGQPFLRNKSANKSSEAARFSFEYNRSLLIEQVRTLYAEYWYLEHKLDVYDQALAVIGQVLRSAKDRQAEGTESGIQVQRFTIEKNRYLQMRNEAEMDMMDARNQLVSMITPSNESEVEFEVESSLSVQPVTESLENLRQYALQHRSDLQALELEAEASGLKYKVEKRERLPDFTLNVGYKNQSNGSEGFVIGGGIKLPIFNRNRGNITVAEAEHKSLVTTLQITNRTIRNQVDVAYQRVQNLYEQWQNIQQNPLMPNMLETTQAIYGEGRYSLVELLDATKAYVDGRSLYYRINADYSQALFRLDTITSGKILTQKNSDQ